MYAIRNQSNGLEVSRFASLNAARLAYAALPNVRRDGRLLFVLYNVTTGEVERAGF